MYGPFNSVAPFNTKIMGIPSYFSYIIKNHSNIIRGLKSRFREKKNARFSSLYMDCNSIIYDAVRKLESEGATPKHAFEDRVISEVISKIEYYIRVIQPSNVVYIAFDGVAPFAKMEQQRVRRYKNGYLASVDFSREDGTPVAVDDSKWNTSAITPGTDFMRELSTKVRRAFSDKNPHFGVNTIVVSPSDESGEGEHKMFQYMRRHSQTNETIAVYGLDSDLIMLSLFQCFYCENIYIFRESPAFGKALLTGQYGEKELICLDNRDLAKAILSEMGIVTEMEDARERIYDYVFMCFLLGNDFLPHFPALNIRTHGNFTVLETYKRVVGNRPDRRFIQINAKDGSRRIQWRWVKAFLSELSKTERTAISEEYLSRAKMEARFYPTTTKQERETAFDNVPVIYRGEEHYINPLEQGWEHRYYRALFHLNTNPTQDFVSSICRNYLEGLEWVFKYYTSDCPHWRWKYEFHYPPLLSDLIKHVPDSDREYILPSVGVNKPFKPQTQLAYVIPVWNHSLLLSDKTKQALVLTGSTQYYTGRDELRFQWAFCRYFWEAHAVLKSHPLVELERLDAAV